MRTLVRSAFLIAVVVLTLIAAVGCSSGASPAPSQPTAAPSKPAEQAPSAASTPAAAQAKVSFPKMTLKYGHVGSLETTYHLGVVKFSELVKERTGGAIEVQVFPASQLGAEKDQIEQVKGGVLHFFNTAGPQLAPFEGWGAVGVLNMPYVIKGNTEQELYANYLKLAQTPIMKDITESAAKASGIRAVDMTWWYGNRNLTTKSKQVVKPEDIKGLKIRTPDAPLYKAAFSALGASTTAMSMGEVYTALQLGVVEGQENPINTIWSYKLNEVQKYLSLTGHMTVTSVEITNDKWWQSLAPEVRDVLNQAMLDAGKYQTDLQLKANTDNLNDLKAKGMIVSEVNKAEWAEKTKDAWKEFESSFGKGMYEKITAAAN